MDGYKLGVVETHFAELIWQHEPLTSGELVKLCEQELQWKKSTTYTVLKKLCEHGIFQMFTVLDFGVPVMSASMSATVWR